MPWLISGASLNYNLTGCFNSCLSSRPRLLQSWSLSFFFLSFWIRDWFGMMGIKSIAIILEDWAELRERERGKWEEEFVKSQNHSLLIIGLANENVTQTFNDHEFMIMKDESEGNVCSHRLLFVDQGFRGRVVHGFTGRNKGLLRAIDSQCDVLF